MHHPDPLAVYIHWPYCARICPYCDFNVYKAKGDANTTLLNAIVADLSHWRQMSGPRNITSIHFGGGTPSLLSPDDISLLVKTVDRLWSLPSKTEIALEANPTDANEMRWRGYKDAGINRLSLGVQSFNSPALKFLGRDHDGSQALAALNMGVGIFESVSADIIFGWAGQTQAELKQDIQTVTRSNLQHISTYQLTIEDGTAFAKAEARGDIRTVNEDDSADFFDVITDTLCHQGFDHYEVSNFAKPEHQSRHNLAYWRGHDYVGVGPGAHGRLTVKGHKHAMICELTPTAYIHHVKQNKRGYKTPETLTPQARAEEYVLMGLRISEGFSLNIYEEISGIPLLASRFEPLLADGLLTKNKDRLSATSHGRLVLNALTNALLV